MRLFIILTIFKKELLETLRDRRTVARMLVLPLLLYPLLVIGVTKFAGSESEARRARASKVAVWGSLPAELGKNLEASGRIELAPWAGAPADLRRELEAGAHKPPVVPDPDVAEIEYEAKAEGDREELPRPSRYHEPENPVKTAARASVSSRDVDAVLVLWPGFSEAVAGGREGATSIYFDSVRRESAQAEERLTRLFRIERVRIGAEREAQAGLAKGFTTAIDVVSRNVAPKKREIGQLIGALLPTILITMALLGGFLPAIDLTAGEKERGTMQTLLCAPLHPLEIIWGKFLAVWTSSLLTSLVNVVSLALTFRRVLPGEIDVPPSIYGLIFILLLPVTFLFSALFLALASFARDFKDAQNVLMPVYMPLTLLSGLAGLPFLELNAFTSFVPVLNIALLIKAVFVSDLSADLVLLSLGSSALYAGLALALAARVFEREHVLLGGRESARALFGLSRRHGGEPTAAFSLTVFGVIEVASFYGGLLLSRFGALTQVLAVELGFFLLPTIGATLAFGFSMKQTLSLRPPSPRVVLGSILTGLSAGVVAIGVLFRLVPAPEPVARKLGDLMLLGGRPFLVVLLCVAVMPAICEELLFRGLLFSGLRRLGPLAAVLFTALLFGFAHGSIYRLAPTTFLGLTLGYARLRTRSLASGVIIHALNNGLAVAVVYYHPPWAEALLEGGTVPWALTLAALAVFAGGLALLGGQREPTSREAPAR